MFHLRVRHIAFVGLLGLVIGPVALAPRVAAAIPVSSIDLRRPQITGELSAELAKPPPAGLMPARSGKAIPLTPKAAATGPQREVFGFVQASVLDDPTVGYPSWDFSMLTTVAYFAVHIRSDGY